MPRLIQVNGENAGDVILLTGATVVLGREENKVIQVPDPNASRKHAQLYPVNDTSEYAVKDLNSKNGTLVNNMPIKSSAALSDGDTISIGSITYLYESTTDGSANLAIARKKATGQGNLDTL